MLNIDIQSIKFLTMEFAHKSHQVLHNYANFLNGSNITSSKTVKMHAETGSRLPHCYVAVL